MMGRTELCAWLRANSSGDYRPAADAADEIEQLAAATEQHFAQAMTNGAKAREYRDEAEALRGALLLMRGRLLAENPHAVTTEADALLLGPNVELTGAAPIRADAQTQPGVRSNDR